MPLFVHLHSFCTFNGLHYVHCVSNEVFINGDNGQYLLIMSRSFIIVVPIALFVFLL